MSILRAIEDSPLAHVESIRTGRHPFEHKPMFSQDEDSQEEPRPMDEARQMICIDAYLLDAYLIGESLPPPNPDDFMRNLQRLDLQLRIGEECFTSSTDYRIGALLRHETFG